MKQHITIEQIKELNEKGRKRYKTLQKKYKWFDAQMVWLNDTVYLLTLGQLMEILVKDKNYTFLGNLEQNKPKHWVDILWVYTRLKLNK